MYTDEMRRAFRSLRSPKNFSVEIVDNEHFLVVRADEKAFTKLHHDDKVEAIKYMVSVKKALEENGAIVLLVRKAIDK
jgi:hypothetical protein